MFESNRLLSAALIIIGIAFCLIFPLSIVWPSGWAWHQGSPVSNDYFMMIVGVYVTLGLFLIRAAKNPSANASLIWFTVWSSVIHALVMAAESLRSPMQHGHLVGDVPVLLAAAIVLGGVMARTHAKAAAAQ
jgi:hypothetical protein